MGESTQELPPFGSSYQMQVMVLLSTCRWYDVTVEAATDPSAAQTFAVAFPLPTNPVFLLSVYVDEPNYALSVISDDLDGPKAVTKEQFKIHWLWEQIKDRAVSLREE